MTTTMAPPWPTRYYKKVYLKQGQQRMLNVSVESCLTYNDSIGLHDRFLPNLDYCNYDSVDSIHNILVRS
jgi:hypothetical protein